MIKNESADSKRENSAIGFEVHVGGKLVASGFREAEMFEGFVVK